MSDQRSIRRRVRHRKDGVDFAADINAEIAVNTGPGQTAVSRSKQRTVISQTSKTNPNDDNKEKR